MLVDRHAELDEIGRAVDRAAAGEAAVLVLAGPAGIGKSALLEAGALVATEAGLTVLKVVGVQAERDVPYAGLHALVSQLTTLPELPSGQQRAVDVALGGHDGPAPGSLLLGSAMLGLLAAQEPLLVVVDDAQWLDRPSVAALFFAVRRLRADPVAVLVAVRSDDGVAAASPLAGLPLLRLPGITDGGALLPHVHAGVAAALARTFDGNPLAMLESAAVSLAGGDGRRPTPAALTTVDPAGAGVCRSAGRFLSR